MTKLFSFPTVFYLKVRPIITRGPPYILNCGGLSGSNVLSDEPLTSLTNAMSVYASNISQN